jgi:voltage-gated potassium channel
MTPARRLALALSLLALVLLLGTVGYMALGLSPLDAFYQTSTTISTVGFREVTEFGPAEKMFTIVVIGLGFATVVFAIGQVVEFIVEGHLQKAVGRRRMDRTIAALSGHVVLCGWGRVGRSFADHVPGATPLVVVDSDPSRLDGCPHPHVPGDATDDAALRAAGLERAGTLIAALATDADNTFVVLSARAMNPSVFIVARARDESAGDKLRTAGADRVVNPHELGGARMAALVSQPHVSEFVDVVMHEGGMEFQLAEVQVPAGSPLVGQSLGDAHLRANTGALVLAMRNPDGSFTTNPSTSTELVDGQILIAIGTEAQIERLRATAAAHR